MDRLCGIKMFNYETKDISIFKKKGTQIGFYAHDLKDAFPELNNIVEGEKDAVTEEGGYSTTNNKCWICSFTHEVHTRIELSNKIVELENKLL